MSTPEAYKEAFAATVIPEEVEVVVPEDTQYIVRGSLVLEGDLDLSAPEAELVIL